MLNQTSNRSHGRFIKKTDPMRKVMTIHEFNLLEIYDKPVTYHDNANANIIHNKLHAQEELAEGVRDSFEINLSFPHESRPVIRPLDFTDEWKKQKKRMANRNQRLEEEEEFELDVTSLLKEKKLDFKKASYKVIESPTPAKNKGDPSKKLSDEIVKPTINLFPQAIPVSSASIKSAAAESKPKPAPIVEMAEFPAISPIAEPEGFVPYYPAKENSQTVQRMEPISLSEDERERLRQEARSEGYQQGFQQGEEKGTMSAQDKVHTITEELAGIIENLQGMQKSILTHVQENFLMICQSFIEALLHKEFKINPESFGAVIERAISDALPEDDFIIHVSPKAFQDLSNWSDPSMRKRLRIDEKLKDDHFRVEGKHSVVDGDLPKIIRELLDQADIQLFESKEKAS